MYKNTKSIPTKQIKIPRDHMEDFIGESIEDKVRRVTNTGAPVESISPMVYTERKEGVLPETNIRTDKWDIALVAMDTIANGKREVREKRIAGEIQGINPPADSEINDPK